MSDVTGRPDVSYGSWLCENSSERWYVEVSRTKWCITESNRAVLIQFDGALENCVFYILPVYEFSHSQGQQRRISRVRNISASPPTSDMTADVNLRREGHKRSSAYRIASQGFTSSRAQSMNSCVTG